MGRTILSVGGEDLAVDPFILPIGFTSIRESECTEEAGDCLFVFEYSYESRIESIAAGVLENRP